jgi:hypothetical protein
VAELVLHSEETVGKVERAERWPTKGFTKRCDVALDTAEALMRLWPDVEQQRLACDGRRRRSGNDSNSNRRPVADRI